MNTIDCRGLKCPKPVINTKKYFESIEEGIAEIVVDNEVAKNNIIKLAESSSLKHEVLEKEGAYYIKVTKEKCGCEVMEFKSKKFTIVVSTDMLGVGDDKLGAALMKSYMFALAESDSIPQDILFLNGGVKLVVEGSEVLESLDKLKERGVSLASCGTCLDFYGLKDKLAIGEVTNMYTIIEKMNNADKTIKL